MKQFYANGHAMPVKSDGVTKLQSDESPVHTDQIIRQKGTVTIPLMYGKGTKGVPLMYGECTKGVLKRYWKGTTNVLRRYWTYTDDLLSVGTPRVPRDRTDRQSVGHDRTRVRGGYHTAPGSVGALFDCCSTVLRQLFDYESKRCRSGLEEQSKPTRSGLEQESNKSRSDVEEIGLSQGFWYRTTAGLNADILLFFVFHPFVGFQRMMRNKAIRICVYGFVSMLFNNAALAQSQDTLGAVNGVEEIRPLQIGDTVPEELWNLPLQVINHPDGKDTITLADYKDKLIILDFWATWCAPCIKSLHKLDTLQRDFESEVVIVPSTYEVALKGREFLKRQKLSLMSLASDTLLRKYFPYRSIPHQVWLSNNRLRAIAHAEDATAENIGLFLEDESLTLHSKRDLVDFDRNESITLYAKRVNTPVRFTSALTHYIEGVGSSVFNTTMGDVSLVSYINVPIIMMYSRTLGIPNNHLVLEGVDKSDYVHTQYRNDLLYCYQLTVPSYMAGKKLSDRVINDLNQNFRLKLDSQIVNTDCYVIVDRKRERRSDNQPSLNSKVHSNDITSLLHLLNDFVSWKPDLPIYISESTYNGKITLTGELVKSIKEDPDQVKLILEEHGLTLIKKRRPTLMYYISGQM